MITQKPEEKISSLLHKAIKYMLLYIYHQHRIELSMQNNYLRSKDFLMHEKI